MKLPGTTDCTLTCLPSVSTKLSCDFLSSSWYCMLSSCYSTLPCHFNVSQMIHHYCPSRFGRSPICQVFLQVRNFSWYCDLKNRWYLTILWTDASYFFKNHENRKMYGRTKVISGVNWTDRQRSPVKSTRTSVKSTRFVKSCRHDFGRIVSTRFW